jgi:hypothetical protein
MLPVDGVMIIAATTALLTRDRESRNWKIFCIIALTFAILGATCEIISRPYIKAQMERVRALPVKKWEPPVETNSQAP